MVKGPIVLPSDASLAALDDEGFVILDDACASTAFTDDVRHDIENLFKGPVVIFFFFKHETLLLYDNAHIM